MEEKLFGKEKLGYCKISDLYVYFLFSLPRTCSSKKYFVVNLMLTKNNFVVFTLDADNNSFKENLKWF